MYIDKKDLITWIEKELKAKRTAKKSEWLANCPFCDNKENHWDYTINIEKMTMNCWRGFDPRCESGHNLFSLVALYYDVTYKKANEIIRKKFQAENSLHRIKKRIKSFEKDRILNIESVNIDWQMPKESYQVVGSDLEGGRKALEWLLKTRRLPLELIEYLRPRYFEESKDERWRKYKNRVFFPVSSGGNKAWLAYSMDKKSTKKRPKTMNPPGRILSNMLYLYDNYVGESKPIILTEGLFDGIRLFMYGYNSVVGFGTTVSSEQIDLFNLSSTKEIVVCYDPDATEYKKNNKGKYTSRAIKVASKLKEYFFGDISIMRLKRADPDDSTYKEVKIAYKNRVKFGDKLWRIKRLAN